MWGAEPGNEAIILVIPFVVCSPMTDRTTPCQLKTAALTNIALSHKFSTRDIERTNLWLIKVYVRINLSTFTLPALCLHVSGIP